MVRQLPVCGVISWHDDGGDAEELQPMTNRAVLSDASSAVCDLLVQY